MRDSDIDVITDVCEPQTVVEDFQDFDTVERLIQGDIPQAGVKVEQIRCARCKRVMRAITEYDLENPLRERIKENRVIAYLCINEACNDGAYETIS